MSFLNDRLLNISIYLEIRASTNQKAIVFLRRAYIFKMWLAVVKQLGLFLFIFRVKKQDTCTPTIKVTKQFIILYLRNYNAVCCCNHPARINKSGPTNVKKICVFMLFLKSKSSLKIKFFDWTIVPQEAKKLLDFSILFSYVK